MTKRILLLVLLAFGVACSKSPAPASSGNGGKPSTAATSATSNSGAPKPVPAQLPATIAKVNGEAITKADFERAAEQFQARMGGPVPPEKRDEFYRGLLDELIAMKLLAQQSKPLKLNVADAEVDAQIKQIQGQFQNEDAFKKALAERHTTLDQLKADQRQSMNISKVIQTQVIVTPKEVEDFYAKNPEKFKQPEVVHVAHILITTPPNADAAAKAKAKAEAQAILKQLKGGADFATLAKQKSQDPGSAPNGGDLPFFPRAKEAPGGQGMVPEFENAAFALTKPNQLSPIVETQFGFHIIKMIERRAPSTVALDQAREQINNFLGNQKTVEYVQSLKAKSKIEIFI